MLHETRSNYDYEYRRRYDTRYDRNKPETRYREREDTYERPRRKNGYVYEDIYSDFDEAQGRLSLFRPIRPEYLNLPTNYEVKYNSLPRNYYNYDDRNNRKYKKDYYDFRIENERRRSRESYEPYRRRVPEREVRKTEPQIYERTPKPKIDLKTNEQKGQKPKNVAVCKPLRLDEKNARYWTTDVPERTRARPKKPEDQKKNVKFSEVSGCNRKMIVDDPICGRKVVPVRELEVSLDQMIQNGYFEKHNIPISRPLERAAAKEEILSGAVPNGKCLSGGDGMEKLPPRRTTRHLPQVSLDKDITEFYLKIPTPSAAYRFSSLANQVRA